MAQTSVKAKISKKRKFQNLKLHSDAEESLAQNNQEVADTKEKSKSPKQKQRKLEGSAEELSKAAIDGDQQQVRSKEKGKQRKKLANLDLQKKLKAAGIIKKKKQKKSDENAVSQSQGQEEPINAAAVSFGRKERKKLLEVRKSKTNKNFTLIRELTKYWEVLRLSDQSQEKRAQLIAKILRKAKGQLVLLCRNHVASRIIQSVIKFGSPEDFQTVMSEIKEEIVNLSKDQYSHHVIKKIIAAVKASEVDGLVRLFTGNIVQLLRHPCGCSVIDDLYMVAKPSTQKQMLAEFYGKEYRLFGSSIMDGQPTEEDHQKNTKYITFEEIWKQAAEAERKNIMRYLGVSMTAVMEKQLLDAQMTHKLLSVYVEHAPASLVQEAVQSLCGEQLLRMVHTRDGARTACLVVGYSGVKERKKLVKALKGHVVKMAKDSFGHAVLVSLLDKVDDTTILNKIVIQELLNNLGELCEDRFGSRVLLHLLSPYNKRHVTPFFLNHIYPCPQKKATQTVQSNIQIENVVQENQDSDIDEEDDQEKQLEETILGLSKKDDLVRRTELLTDSKTKLLQKLFDKCITETKFMLTTRFCDFVIQELCIGGKDGFLVDLANEQVDQLQDAICNVIDKEVMDNFFGNRSLHYMVMQERSSKVQKGASRSFAKKLWERGLVNSGDNKVKKEVKKQLEGEEVVDNFEQWLNKFGFGRQ